MERTTIFMPANLRLRLADEAHRRRLSQAAIIREALEHYLDESHTERPHLVGVAAVPRVDAKTAKAWTRDQWARKAREG
jgi:predicted DNA-binding protein